MSDAINDEELAALVRAIKFLRPDYSLKQVHAQVHSYGARFSTVSLARVKKFVDKLSNEWLPMELDVPMMETAPYQSMLSLNMSTSGAALGALGEIYKIQKGINSNQQPLLVYNKDRSRKTFLHPSNPAYSRVSEAIDRIGHVKAYFFGHVQGNTLFVNVKTLADFQPW